MSKFIKPRSIYVVVDIPANKTNGIKPFTARVGWCNEPSEIQALINNDIKEMGDTLGGLIPAVSTKGRKYRAFQAEWTELKL